MLKRLHSRMNNNAEETCIAVLNPIPFADRDRGSSITKQLEEVGQNTGNILFVEAIKGQLSYQYELPIGFKDFNDLNISSAVVPSANFIFPKFVALHKSVQKLLENTSFPITFAGLGAQSKDISDDPNAFLDTLPDITKEALYAMSKRCVSLGVRGAFTGRCLEALGISNYRVIGCPSIYGNLKGKSLLPQPKKDRVVVNITTGSQYETKLLELAYSNKIHWIMQMPTEFIDQINIEKAFPGFFDLNIRREDLLYYYKNYSHMFFNINDWNIFLKKNKFTFSFGSRFHGNVMAMKNGIPALWVTHDSRTQELVDTFSFPYIKETDMLEITDIDQLVERCDYEKFYNKYPKLLSNYKAYLRENSLSIQSFI